MAVGNVQVPVHQGANNVGVAANHQAPQQQGAVQFRSGNKNIFTRIAEHIGLKTPHTAHGAPNAGITLKTPSKRDLLTTFASVSMGDRADRTEATGRVDEHGMAVPDMAQHRQNISTRLQFTNVNGAAVDTRARLNLNYTITNFEGGRPEGLLDFGEPRRDGVRHDPAHRAVSVRLGRVRRKLRRRNWLCLRHPAELQLHGRQLPRLRRQRPDQDQRNVDRQGRDHNDQPPDPERRLSSRPDHRTWLLHGRLGRSEPAGSR